MKPSTSQATHFREVFRKSFHHVNTNRQCFKASGTDVEDFFSMCVSNYENECKLFRASP